MRLIIIPIAIIFCYSCSSDTLTDSPISDSQSTDYYLNFSIKDSLYFEHQDSFQVESFQDLEFELTFVDAYQSNHKYPYYSIDNTAPDSVDIIGTIRFQSDGLDDFEEKIFDLEFVVSEALVNLEKIDEKTYEYIDISMFYDQLISNEFGNKNLFTISNRSSMFMTFPFPTVPSEIEYHSTMSSNGFYFPHEKLDFTAVQYNPTDNTILLRGRYDVEIKFLSCGFFSTHAVSNAEFQLLIK